MPVETIVHTATVNGIQVLIDLQDEYGAIGDIVGIKVATDADRAAAKISGTGSNLQGQGLLIKLTVAGTVDGKPATKTNKRKTTEIYVTPEKFASAIKGLKDKEIKGSTAEGAAGTNVKFKIRSAYQARKAKFG